MRIAIIGGGIAGLTAAWQLARLANEGAAVEAVLFESSARLGGLVETVCEGGFTIECGPDAWVTAKPWARELAIELGLEAELLASNDADRKTWLLHGTPPRLVAMPDGMNMMVPASAAALAALDASPLFTPAAVAAYRAEPARAAQLLASTPAEDESIADFTVRHFGPEVLDTIVGPLLSGIVGGDVHTLSVRAMMPAFVEMERTHGSLVTALQATRAAAPSPATQPAVAGQVSSQQPLPIFTTLRGGLGTLVDHLVAGIPPRWLRLGTRVETLRQPDSSLGAWNVTSAYASASLRRTATESFDAVLLAAPLDATRRLLVPLIPDAAELLPAEASSAVLVALGFSDAARVSVPPGFGFLVPPGSGSHLLACTFVDQKFRHRVPQGGRLLRAFFGGAVAERLLRANNDEVAAIARLELSRILNAAAPFSTATPTPLPSPIVTVVRRWPSSLPQYAVGHPARAAALVDRLERLPGLTLLGNPLHGVGLPDLIRAARIAARNTALRARAGLPCARHGVA